MTDATTAGPEWPTTRWGLSAPESYVVLNGPGANGSDAFKLGLMELVARGTLALETIEQRGRFTRKSVAMLRDGPRSGAPREQPLAAIWQIYERIPHQVTDDGQSRVAVEDLARAAARQYQSLGRYIRRDVLPALIDRGLYEARRDRLLWIFPRTRHVLTPSGESARHELQRWLEVGAARFSGWADNEPSHAMAYAAMAGASLLLMPALFPDMRRLRDQTGIGGADAAGYSGATMTRSNTVDDERPDTDISNDPSSLDTSGLSIGGLQLPSFDLSSLDFGSLDFSSFDALDSAMSAIDAAVDSGGGGDSGGDGGSSGGDGGGGGGGDSGGGGDGGGGGES
jgi:hypothetical protein